MTTSTVKESAAKVDHRCGRFGVGTLPSSARIRAMVERPTWILRLRSAPWILV